jgi:hypothetical protein
MIWSVGCRRVRTRLPSLLRSEEMASGIADLRVSTLISLRRISAMYYLYLSPGGLCRGRHTTGLALQNSRAIIRYFVVRPT